VARFKGKATGSVDVKGRVSLPAKYRKLLPEELVLAKSPNRAFPSLVLYPADGFDEWIDNVMESKGGYKANNQQMDDILEEYYENSEDVRVDGIGRISIPSDLRSYASIGKEVVISGAKDHLVLRSAESWEANSRRRAQASVYDESRDDAGTTDDSRATNNQQINPTQ
jgi:MraZ protein